MDLPRRAVSEVLRIRKTDRGNNVHSAARELYNKASTSGISPDFKRDGRIDE
jgi:hypothetical protein